MPDGPAVLLLAHEKNASALASRIELIARQVGPVFVHLDEKAGEEAYAQLREALGFIAGTTDVHLLDRRHSVHWGGDDMLLAMLALLDAATANRSFSHYVFASSTHFPLHHRGRSREILDGLHGKTGRESKPMPVSQIIRRLVIPFDKRQGRVRLSINALIKNISALTAFWSRYGRPNWGSQWVVIAHQDIPQINSARHPIESGDYSNWKILDEVFFQSVLRKSGRDFLSTYFQFDKNNNGSPNPITIMQANAIAQSDSDHIFVRKVELGAELPHDTDRDQTAPASDPAS